jgi:hypothetical protein
MDDIIVSAAAFEENIVSLSKGWMLTCQNPEFKSILLKHFEPVRASKQSDIKGRVWIFYSYII